MFNALCEDLSHLGPDTQAVWPKSDWVECAWRVAYQTGDGFKHFLPTIFGRQQDAEIAATALKQTVWHRPFD